MIVKPDPCKNVFSDRVSDYRMSQTIRRNPTIFSGSVAPAAFVNHAGRISESTTRLRTPGSSGYHDYPSESEHLFST
jgi:hypothetical protein